jgi:hypothetical protein
VKDITSKRPYEICRLYTSSFDSSGLFKICPLTKSTNFFTGSKMSHLSG